MLVSEAPHEGGPICHMRPPKIRARGVGTLGTVCVTLKMITLHQLD